MMHLANEPAEQFCQQCDKPLFGRTDKRFCNDTCRNTYNRERRSRELKNELPFIRKVTQAIHKNHEIMERMAQHRQLPCTISRYELIELGFHFKFFTSIRKQKDGSIYYFCFEYGWKETNDNRILLVVNYEQAEI